MWMWGWGPCGNPVWGTGNPSVPTTSLLLICNVLTTKVRPYYATKAAVLVIVGGVDAFFDYCAGVERGSGAGGAARTSYRAMRSSPLRTAHRRWRER